MSTPPAPTHLAEITQPDLGASSEGQYVADVRCLCGSRLIHVMYVGERRPQGDRPAVKVTRVGDKSFLIVRADCPACGRQHVLLDKDLHGWNGYVVNLHEQPERRAWPRPDPALWRCDRCQSPDHAVRIAVVFDKLTILGEGEIESADGNVIINEQNWPDGFGWIDIHISCGKCGLATTKWISYETM